MRYHLERSVSFSNNRSTNTKTESTHFKVRLFRARLGEGNGRRFFCLDDINSIRMIICLKGLDHLSNLRTFLHHFLSGDRNEAIKALNLTAENIVRHTEIAHAQTGTFA